MTESEEIHDIARRIVTTRDGRMVSAELAQIGNAIFGRGDAIERLALLIPTLPGICVHALLLSNLAHLTNWKKREYQRLFQLLQAHPIATYDLTTFLVGYADIKGPLLRELAGNSKPFRDIAKHQMANAILGDGLAPKIKLFADGRPPEEMTIDDEVRMLGLTAEELRSFREDVKEALLQA